jgi:hypothetical protein
MMACNRKGCENVRCSRTILHGQARICNRCFKELKAYKETWSPRTFTDINRVQLLVRHFMSSTSPGAFAVVITQSDIDEEFRRLTNG